MRSIEIKQDQSLLDIALQEYGHSEGVFYLVKDNRNLVGITDNVYKGDKLFIRKEKINSQMQGFLWYHNIATVKGVRGEGIGYWGVERDFKVR